MLNNLKNEKGTALLMALIMLLLLTLIGFAAVTTSSIEVQITGNQRIAATAMYCAEAAIESIRQELNSYIGPAPEEFITLANSESADPNCPYSIYRGIQRYPNKGDLGGGDYWEFYNPSNNGTGNKVIVIDSATGVSRNTDGSPMFVFIVEGTSGFAAKRIEVGIVPRETVAGGSDPSGTTY